MTGCAKHDASIPASQVLRLSQRNEPATLDPQLATLPDEFFVIRALSEGLLTPGPDGAAPQPGVAEKWEVSSDGLTWTFHLRTNARWSNGDPVTAEDFIYSIHRALNRATAAPKAPLFLVIRGAFQELSGVVDSPVPLGVAAPDAHTLVLTLDHPTADLPALAASGPWIPVHRATVERFGENWIRPGNFVGNGPFTLTAWRPNQEIVVQRNANYRDAAKVRLREIRFVAFDSGDSEERAFRAGQLDVTMAVPFSKLAPYRSAQPTVLRQIPLHELRYLSLNITRPPLDNPAVRRAIIAEKVLQGGQQPAFNFIPPGLGSYQPDQRIAENADEARRLLREAGYPDGRGFPKLELATWVNTPVLEAIQQMWRRELGIEVTIAQREARTHLASLAAGDYAIALMTAIPDYDGASDLFTTLTSGNPGNYPHWRSAEFDQLVAEAGRSGAAPARLAAYQQAEKVLLDAMPLIPLYFNTQNYLIQPRVKNWRTDRLWTRFYPQLSVE